MILSSGGSKNTGITLCLILYSSLCWVRWTYRVIQHESYPVLALLITILLISRLLQRMETSFCPGHSQPLSPATLISESLESASSMNFLGCSITPCTRLVHRTACLEPSFSLLYSYVLCVPGGTSMILFKDLGIRSGPSGKQDSAIFSGSSSSLLKRFLYIKLSYLLSDVM